MFLDSSFCIDLMREHNQGVNGPATTKLKSLGETGILISIFVVCELRAGAEMSKNPMQELARVESLVESLNVVYPDRSSAVLYGETVAALLKHGTPVPLMDVLVGVAAKAFGLPILTRDIDHFQKIPGLVVIGY